MPTEVIRIEADNIDSAAEQIIAYLEGTRSGDVIYFSGWEGLGASPVLKAIVKRLRSSSSVSATRKAAGLDKIIHVDCSVWQSKRALQKAIAEELNLSHQLMAFFDQRDEEDDFDGVEQGARGVVPNVKAAIFNELSKCNFLVVFHNGSGSYVDLWECGVPAIGDMSKRVLWSCPAWFQLRYSFLSNEEVKKAAGLSDMAISATISGNNWDEVDWRLLHAEAEEVAVYVGVLEPDMSPKVVLDCFLYKALRADEYGIDWPFHAPNYWVCDGIIQASTNGGRSAWEIGDALHRSMNLDRDDPVKYLRGMLSSHEDQWSHTNRWYSATHQRAAPVQMTTSFFWTAAGPNSTMILEASMFGHSEIRTSLRVMHLSHCIFSFSSPPFQSCINLRFLLLDHCKDQDATNPIGEEEYYKKSNHTSLPCFLKLWVLELSYTDWHWLLSKEMMDVMVDLRELNVKGVRNWSMSHIHRCSGAGNNSRRLLKLRVIEEFEDTSSEGGSRNNEASPPVVKILDLSSWRMVKTVILEGCIYLEQVGTNALPPTIESFSFVVSNNASAMMTSMSFQGCTQLRNLLLRGLLGRLEELDLSRTAVKTLDLSLVEAQKLRRLFMLGCEKLRAILWPKKNKARLKVLQIDTTCETRDYKEDTSKKQEEAAGDNTLVGSSSTTVHVHSWTLIDSGSSCIISLKDTRLFRSLEDDILPNALCIEISTTGKDVTPPVGYRNTSHQETNRSASSGKQQMRTVNLRRPAGKLYTDDVFAADGGAIGAPSVIRWMWSCPPIPIDSNCVNCYISIQDEAQTDLMQSTSSTKQGTSVTTTLPGFVATNAMTLHVHDNLSITCIPGPSISAAKDLRWGYLRWCRLERCPNLEGTVFTAPSLKHNREYIFWYLKTFWASQLQKARYIWDWTASSFQPGRWRSFEDLVFLHLDYCPRLVHVLPLYDKNSRGCQSLETLEIVCCGELREVFPLVSSESQQQEPRKFPNLKRIHLYELPLLQRICGRRMSTPKLETIKIRGCWGLRSLPSIGHPSGRGSMALPMVDCEKDLWDGLEWDGLEAGHHPSLYKTAHSAYYKKTLRRTTVLR